MKLKITTNVILRLLELGVEVLTLITQNKQNEAKRTFHAGGNDGQPNGETVENRQHAECGSGEKPLGPLPSNSRASEESGEASSNH